jgi:hypothetical protein
VVRGEPLATVHARDPGLGARARDMVRACVRVTPGPVAAPPLVLAEGGG